MSYVVDTDVLSRTSPSTAQSIPGLREWLARNSEQLHLSVVSLMEISYGIAWLRHRKAQRKAALLQGWLDDVVAFTKAGSSRAVTTLRSGPANCWRWRAPAALRSAPRTP